MKKYFYTDKPLAGRALSNVAETFLQDFPLPPHTPHWSFVFAEFLTPSQPTFREEEEEEEEGSIPLAMLLPSRNGEDFEMVGIDGLFIITGVIVTGTQDPFMHHCNAVER